MKKTTRAPAPPRPKITKLSYTMSVKVGGRTALSFSGHSQEELDRDLQAAAAELGAGVAEQNGGRR